MLWLLGYHDKDAEIEVNMDELKNFIITEALFLREIDALLEKSFNLSNIFSGKSILFASEAFMTYWGHILENIQYFRPKELINESSRII